MDRRRFVSLCGAGVAATGGCSRLRAADPVGDESADPVGQRDPADGSDYGPASVVTGSAEARAPNGVTLRGRMESFGPHHRVMAGFSVPAAGADDPGLLLPVWNPAAVARGTPKPADDGPTVQYGPSFALHVVDSQPRERPNDVSQWRLERGETYAYRAVASLPRPHDDELVTGERKRFTVPAPSETA